MPPSAEKQTSPEIAPRPTSPEVAPLEVPKTPEAALEVKDIVPEEHPKVGPEVPIEAPNKTVAAPTIREAVVQHDSASLKALDSIFIKQVEHGVSALAKKPFELAKESAEWNRRYLKERFNKEILDAA